MKNWARYLKVNFALLEFEKQSKKVNVKIPLNHKFVQVSGQRKKMTTEEYWRSQQQKETQKGINQRTKNLLQIFRLPTFGRSLILMGLYFTDVVDTARNSESEKQV